MAFERLLRLTKKCPGYVVSGLRNASVGIATVTQRVVRKPILHHPGSFWRPVTFCHDTASLPELGLGVFVFINTFCECKYIASHMLVSHKINKRKMNMFALKLCWIHFL